MFIRGKAVVTAIRGNPEYLEDWGVSPWGVSPWSSYFRPAVQCGQPGDCRAATVTAAAEVIYLHCQHGYALSWKPRTEQSFHEAFILVPEAWNWHDLVTAAYTLDWAARP